MRLRVTFSKGGPLVYTSHLDLARAWERALRRAGVRLAYSGGFNPRPKLQLAAALPLGYTAEMELLDVWLEKPVPVEDFARALVPVLSDGLTISQVRQVMLKEPALQTQVVAAEYCVTVEWHPESVEGWDELTEVIEARIEQVLAARELPRERRGRQYDLRPLVERLWLERRPEMVKGQAVGNDIVLGMQLAARAGATARPEAVLDALEMGGPFARYRRVRLIGIPGVDLYD
ncbi:MAG: TIGR03936 family radical SAM-associated protein [Chloroflexota bacterium]|nr:TIGR03936 family radical SAM-associated protein [Chloroflexota bacterium]